MSESEMDTVGVDTAVASPGTSVYPSKISFASESLADGLPDRYLSDDGCPVSWETALERYQNHRIGEEASSDANGYTGGLRQRAKSKMATIYKADRTFRAEFDNPRVGLATIFGKYSPVDPNYGPILDYEQVLAEAIDGAAQTIKYRLRQKRSSEYALIEAGTGTNGVPHWHLIVWADKTDANGLRTDLEAIVCRAQEKLPSNLREFDPDINELPSGAVRVDDSPNTDLKVFPADKNREPANPIARYVGNQLPHVGSADPEVNVHDGMTKAELQFGAIADASSRRGYRSSAGVSRF
ncbi:hypothetical protein [Natronorubrum bangense]|uniref:hypothetical protein n=1 Tax=Natronorubrum bangense TaxID=61858 RepID=UPI0010A2D58D|nr:hypothetical protein [Natronorubrum bangense]